MSNFPFVCPESPFTKAGWFRSVFCGNRFLRVLYFSAPAKVFAISFTALRCVFCSVWWGCKENKQPPPLLIVYSSCICFSKHLLIMFCVLTLGVHYPSLASLCSQKVVESERGFLMSTVSSGSYLGWVSWKDWWQRDECVCFSEKIPVVKCKKEVYFKNLVTMCPYSLLIPF